MGSETPRGPGIRTITNRGSRRHPGPLPFSESSTRAPSQSYLEHCREQSASQRGTGNRGDVRTLRACAQLPSSADRYTSGANPPAPPGPRAESRPLGWGCGESAAVASHPLLSSALSYCSKEVYNKENLFNSLNYDVAAKKRKKDILNSKAKTQYFHQEKWIYVHKGSTKERHGYCTLGEAFNRLDFSTAILDSRRFNYVVRLLELIAKSQLTSLSGIAQKNFMNILEKVVLKVLEDQQNIRLIRELLQTLYTSLCTLVQRVGKSVLVGNINMWVHRMETILHWQQQLNNIQITRPAFRGLTFTDLPLCLQLNIMQRLSDGRDLVSLGQVAPELHVLSEDRLLWKRLCQYHFSERQIRKRLILSDKGQLDWKKMYFKLIRCYPRKEQYGDTLQLCKHCHILSWKGTDHPCTANNPESCSVSLSPQDFINLFKF
ncbi:F-box only protein 32 [Fukomys damarensis]|nr:F-box only protein 32 [Fukomys damarensis]